MSRLAQAQLAIVGSAEMLVEVSDDIEALGAVLCTDPKVMADHISSLQQIDLIAQKLRALASVLAAECPASATQSLPLDSLRARFRHLAITPPEPVAHPEGPATTDADLGLFEPSRH